jgi:hypothetical protein
MLRILRARLIAGVEASFFRVAEVSIAFAEGYARRVVLPFARKKQWFAEGWFGFGGLGT